jgi:hypothetical protein
MRAMLLLLLPLIWAFAAYVVSFVVAEMRRAKQRPRTIEGEWRDPGAGAYRSPAGRRSRALCGRHNLHLLLRLAFAEDSCKHCAAIREQRRDNEVEEALRAAERYASGQAADDAP